MLRLALFVPLQTGILCLAADSGTELDDSADSSLLQVALDVQELPPVGDAELWSFSADGPSLNVCLEGHLAPELFVIGAQKAATSSLAYELEIANVLQQRPIGDQYRGFQMTGGCPGEFASPKEPHVFDSSCRFGQGRTQWLSAYPDCNEEIRSVAGDMTPDYLPAPEAPSRIREWYGTQTQRLTFVVMLREPLSRMHSGYHYSWNDDNFSAYVDQILEDPSADHGSPFEKSLYLDQVMNWFSVLDSGQFIIVPYRFEFARNDEDPSIADYLLASLGLPPSHQPVPSVNIHSNTSFFGNTSNYQSLDDELEPDSPRRVAIEQLFEERTGSEQLAKVLAASSADLYNYTGLHSNEQGIAEWLSANW